MSQQSMHQRMKQIQIQDQDATIMTTIPSRLSQVSRASTSMGDALSRSRGLYRDWYRAAAIIPKMYGIEVPVYIIRSRIRSWFDANAHVRDLKTINVLLLKGHQEYQETMNLWKPPATLLEWFRPEKMQPTPAPDFLSDFLDGRDDDRIERH